MDLPTEDLEPLLGDVDFLCRSPNRVVVLDALTEGPLERPALEEQTEVARATLGRILDDFEKRNWIRRDGREYRATPVGEFVVEKLATFLEQMEAARTLAPVMRWLPADGFDFDIARLRDAEIIHATEDDPLAPLRRINGDLQSGERVRHVSYEVTTSGLDALVKATARDDQQVEIIFTPGVYDTIRREPDMLTSFREVLDADGAEFYEYGEDKPTLITVIDDVACIGLTENGIPRAVLVSDDEDVYSWAEDTFTEYLSRAEPVESATFAG